MNDYECKLNDLMTKIGNAIFKYCGEISGNLYVDDYILSINQEQITDGNGVKFRNTELRLQDIHKD